MDLLSLFTTEQTSRLTHLSERQLAYWDKEGIYSPQFRDSEGVFRRAYSLRDLVELRALALLRRRVSLQQIRDVGRALTNYEHPWSMLTFWVGGRTVYWENPGQGTLESARPRQQTVLPIVMRVIEAEVVQAVQRFSERAADDIGRISRNRYVQHNEPVVSGTRVPVAAVLDFHKAGYTADAIIAEYPRLKPEDIAAAIEWENQQKAS